MAFRRSLTTRAKLFAQQRFTPSISYVNHHEDRKNQHSDDKVNSFLQTRSYGALGRNTNTLLGFGGINGGLSFRDPKCSQFFCQAPMATSGLLLARNMSTANTMEAVSTQAPAVSEVAAAAASSVDPSLPMAAMQCAIDGMHNFVELNLWTGIIVTTMILYTARLSSISNELKDAPKDISQATIDELKEELKIDISPLVEPIVGWSVIFCLILAIVYIVEKIILGLLFPIMIFCSKAFLCYWITAYSMVLVFARIRKRSSTARFLNIPATVRVKVKPAPDSVS